MFTGPTPPAAAQRQAAGEAVARREAVAAFYARESGRLLARVTDELASGRAVAEDACQTAWLALLGREDVALDASGGAWLRAVALTAGARVARGRDIPAQPVLDHEAGRAVGESEPCERVVELEELAGRRARLLGVSPRQRMLLGLQGLGLSYDEISAVTGNSRRTVQRQLLRGRAALRAR